MAAATVKTLAVVTGDHKAKDPSKLGGAYGPEDLKAQEMMMAALESLGRFDVTAYNDHRLFRRLGLQNYGRFDFGCAADGQADGVQPNPPGPTTASSPDHPEAKAPIVAAFTSAAPARTLSARPTTARLMA